jgi:type IX secretion system PorP/SprF family membrane protein
MRKYNILHLGFWLICLLAATQAQGQQHVMFTQYMFNGLALNPAYAGSHDGLSLTALGRKQWTGLEGAPSTQTFSAHSPLRQEKVGLGLLVLHDQIGVTNQTGVYGSYAYRLQFPERGTLSMGLQAGVNHFNSRFSRVSVSDPTFAGQDVSEWQPSFGFGLYYHTRRFYAGASIPQFNQNIFTRNKDWQYLNQVRHYFITAGYVLDLNESLKLKPNVLIKAVEGAPVELDLNANLLIKEVLWVGASWRSFDSVDALFQLQLTPKLQFGYAYDFITSSEMRRVNSGSHELMINYRLGASGSKIITPRYF